MGTTEALAGTPHPCKLEIDLLEAPMGPQAFPRASHDEAGLGFVSMTLQLPLAVLVAFSVKRESYF